MGTAEERTKTFEARRKEREDKRIRARVMSDAGYTNSAIADTLGVPESTVRLFLGSKNE